MYLLVEWRKAFIPNPMNLPEVNHIDGDKSNNAVNNIEWCNRESNISHAWKIGLYTNKSKRQKIQCVETGIMYDSIVECANILHINKVGISRQLCGRAHTAGGHTFRRVNNSEENYNS